MTHYKLDERKKGNEYAFVIIIIYQWDVLDKREREREREKGREIEHNHKCFW